jgi:large subunit ribosomal protein L21
MYAVIETGGRQYRVELGSEIELDQLDADPGASIELGRVLLVADGEDAHIGRPVVDGARVTADVIRHGRGDKIVVFKYQPKARRRVKRGHRSELTVVRISDIVLGDRSAARDAQEQAEKDAAARAAAEKEAASKAAADQELAAKLAAAQEEAEKEAAEAAEQPAAEDAKADAKPASSRKRTTRKAAAKPTAGKDKAADKEKAAAEGEAAPTGEEAAATEGEAAPSKPAGKKPAARKPAAKKSDTSSKRNRKDE